MCKHLFLLCSLVLIVMFAAVFEDNSELVATEYLSKFKNGEFSEAAKYLHCPDILSHEDHANEVEAISRALNIFHQEFGALVSAKVSSNNDYHAITVGCGDSGYWEKHPPTKQIVYETVHLENRRGYIVFSFSKVAGSYVLAFVNHGVPISNSKSEEKIHDVWGKIVNGDSQGVQQYF